LRVRPRDVIMPQTKRPNAPSASKMTTAAIYSRFSSDLQKDRSIEDQVALCRSYAARHGFSIVATFEDRARSGASVFGRSGLGRLMDAARDRVFNVLIVEELDRIARDQEDLAGIFKRLSFLGIEIRAVHSGVADQVQVGIRGLVGALFLQDLANKVRRGMAGVVRDGRHAGGLAYGYRPVPGKPGELAIEPSEAEIVREIFAAYVAGAVPREIAGRLSARGVRPPRGRVWSAVAINGNKARGSGMLLNPLYAWKIIWNRLRMVKNPDTGKRVSRPNPEAEWQFAVAEHLRIVDQATWEAAQVIKASRTTAPQARTKKPRRMLSGLLKCGACGGGMSIKDRDHGRTRITCTVARETSSCQNRRPYYLDAIERAVVAGLRDRLADKPSIALYLRAYNDERRRLSAETINSRDLLERRLADFERKRERLVDQVVDGVITDDEAKAKLPPVRAEIARLTEELAAAAKPVKIIELHPTAIRDYLAAIDRLDLALQRDRDAGSEESTQALRDLIENVMVHPKDAAGEIALTINGQLARLVGGQPFPSVTISGGTSGSGGALRAQNTLRCVPLPTGALGWLTADTTAVL
jgi:DNA invertase Pin-like site-specific DNA recombinase